MCCCVYLHLFMQYISSQGIIPMFKIEFVSRRYRLESPSEYCYFECDFFRLLNIGILHWDRPRPLPLPTFQSHRIWFSCNIIHSQSCYHFFSCGSTVLQDPDRLTYRRFLELFRHTVGLLGRVISPSQGLYLHRTTQHWKTRTNIHALSGIRTHNPSNQPAKTQASDRTAGVTGNHPTITYAIQKRSMNHSRIENLKSHWPRWFVLKSSSGP
jgi:hypothetical protein